MNLKSSKKGFSLIGAIAGITVASIIILAFTTLISKAVVVNSVNGQRLQAILYLQETIEVAKDLEQWNWGELIAPGCASPQECHPPDPPPGDPWSLIGGKGTVGNIYTRWLTIEPVYRQDSDNEIAALPCTEPCTPDPNTKKIIAEIEWHDQLRRPPLAPNHLKLEAYLYNI